MTNTLGADRLRDATRQELADRFRSRRIAAAALIVGGLAVLLGSLSTWGACAKEPCEGDGGLFHIYERSGIDFGPGIVTAVLGVLLAVLGIYALRNPDQVARPWLAIVAAAAVPATICIHVIRIYVVDDYGIAGSPYFGLYVTTVGGLIALAASVRLWQLRHPDPPPNAATAHGRR